MAEVRLRVGRGAYRFAKPSLWANEGNPALMAAHFVHLPQYCATSPAPGARNACLQTPNGKSPLKLEGLPGSAWSDSMTLWMNAAVTPVSSRVQKHPIMCSIGTSHSLKSRFWRSISFQTHPRLGHFLSSSRAYSRTQNRSHAGPLYRSKSGYYDILEVSPSATHAQIKTAYYKQSFMYHPDRNAGSQDATSRFSQISEAYSVLGNKALRRKYDRGILSQADLNGAGRPTEGESSASWSGQRTRARQSPSVGVGREKIFDFDAFIRAHYGEQLQREKELRQRREKIIRKEKQQYEDVKLGRMKEVAVGMLLVMAMAILLNIKASK